MSFKNEWKSHFLVVLLSDINTCIYRGHSLHESLNHVCDVSFLVKDKQYNRM